MPLPVIFSLNSFCYKNSYITRKMNILHSGQNLFTFIFGLFGIKHGNKAIARREILVLHFHKQKQPQHSFTESLTSRQILQFSQLMKRRQRKRTMFLCENSPFPLPNLPSIRSTFLRLLFSFYLNPAWISVDTYPTNSL